MIDFNKIVEIYRKLPHSGPCLPQNLRDGVTLQKEYVRTKEKMDDLLIEVVKDIEDEWGYTELLNAGYFGEGTEGLHEASLRAERSKK
jgi:hypothetical protein